MSTSPTAWRLRGCRGQTLAFTDTMQTLTHDLILDQEALEQHNDVIQSLPKYSHVIKMC